MDVGARGEGLDQTGVVRQVGDDPQLDLVVVGHQEARSPRPGTKARRKRRPSSVRTGMLCRLGRSEDSRPVRATVWRNEAWMRPSAATSASRVSP